MLAMTQAEYLAYPAAYRTTVDGGPALLSQDTEAATPEPVVIVPLTVINLVVLTRWVAADMQELLLLTRRVPGPATYVECYKGGATSGLFYPVRDDLGEALGEDSYQAGECIIIAGQEVVYHQLINLLASQVCWTQGPINDVARLVSGQPVEDCPALIRRVARRHLYRVAAMVRRPC
jgi:hypothetical protein